MYKKKMTWKDRYEYGGAWMVVDHWGHSLPFVPRWLELWICDRFEQHLGGAAAWRGRDSRF